MPPRYLRKPSPTHLQKCKEFRVDVCDVVKADGCCGVIPCKLCLEWETYLGTSYGSANFGASSWTGSIGTIPFVSYWEVNYDSGECEYVVVFDGVEVYRATCPEGASCRNPAGEVAATADYEDGTLRWSVYEPRELQLIDNPDTGCRTHFCGSCHCSCECVCVTITEYNGATLTGELCDIAYDCDPPVWAGSVGYYELSLALGRDQYGECIITPTVDGVELDAVSAPGCGSMSATITTPEGHVIEVTCKECGCGLSGNVCCPERCNTVNGESCANPLPLTMTCTLTVSTVKDDPRTGYPTECYTVTGTLSLSALNGWVGVVSGTCTGWCTDEEIVFEYEVRVTCGLQGNGDIAWHIDVRDNLGGTATRKCTNNNTPIVETTLTSSCNPIMLTGTTSAFDCTDLACVIPVLGIDQFFGEVRFDVLVTEDP